MEDGKKKEGRRERSGDEIVCNCVLFTQSISKE
jgi:hypothetical protein